MKKVLIADDTKNIRNMPTHSQIYAMLSKVYALLGNAEDAEKFSTIYGVLKKPPHP